MSAAPKAALAAAVAATAAIMAVPLALILMLAPSQTIQQFHHACTAALGARATVLASPPQHLLTTEEVLLKIANTATTLGFSRQGATVTAAISLRATGLANAANPTLPETLRYAHSALLAGDNVGALGLPSAWGTAAELMTPEVSTALALDRMVNQAPQWRDTDPAQLAAAITRTPAPEWAAWVAAAEHRLDQLGSRPARAVATTTPHPPPLPLTGMPANTHTPLSPAAASAAARDSPEAAACLAALTAEIPAEALAANPEGSALAAAAAAAAETPAPTPAPHSAEFVAELLTTTLGGRQPVTIAAQLHTGRRVTGDPEPGDLVFTDISADEGPHLVGVAVDPDTMVTILPGHPVAEQVEIGPNRLIRRIEAAPTP